MVVAVLIEKRNTPSKRDLFHTQLSSSSRLTVSPELLGVLASPGVTTAGAGVVEAVTLVDTTGLLAGRGKTTSLTVLVEKIS